MILTLEVAKLKIPFKLFGIFLILVGAKLTTNGAWRGFASTGTCVGTYRDNMGEYIGGFSTYLDVQSPLYVEFMGVILSLEEASKSIRN